MDHSEVRHFPKVDHTPNEMDAEGKALLKAADLIETGYLLTNGQTTDSKGGFCIWGAITEATPKSYEVENRAMFKVYKALGGGEPFKYFDRMVVCNWNNSHNKEEVVSKLRAVALGL